MRPNPQETADLVTFTEEIPNRKLHFLCSVSFHEVLKLYNFEFDVNDVIPANVQNILLLVFIAHFC